MTWRSSLRRAASRVAESGEQRTGLALDIRELLRREPPPVADRAIVRAGERRRQGLRIDLEHCGEPLCDLAGPRHELLVADLDAPVGLRLPRRGDVPAPCPRRARR